MKTSKHYTSIPVEDEYMDEGYGFLDKLEKIVCIILALCVAAMAIKGIIG